MRLFTDPRFFSANNQPSPLRAQSRQVRQKKAAFEKLCNQEDVTPSQKIRQFMREYIEQNLGPDWMEQVFNNEEKEG